MKVLKDKEISLIKWNSLLSKSRYASAFQSPDFYKLFNSVTNQSAEAIGIEEDSEIKALCVVTLQGANGVKGYFSRRAIIYGGPVLSENNPTYLKYLLESIQQEYKNRTIYIEIRNFNNYSAFDAVYEKGKWRYMPYQNFVIDCSDKEKLFSNLGDNRKRQIKKALRKGVTIKEAESLDEIKEFYSILQDLYKRKIKKPLLPWQFFKEFYENNLGKYLLVIFNGSIIGGILCPVFKDKSIYEFYICGLDDKYKEQHPSIMATWGALEYANKNNIAKFDFMGAGIKDKKYGVRDFKLRFGGELVEYGRFYYVNNMFLYKLGKVYLAFKKSLQ